MKSKSIVLIFIFLLIFVKLISQNISNTILTDLDLNNNDAFKHNIKQLSFDGITPEWQVTFDEATPAWTLDHSEETTKDWCIGNDISRPCYWGPIDVDNNSGWYVYSMDYVFERLGIGESPNNYAYIDIVGDRSNLFGDPIPQGCTMSGVGQSHFNAWILFEDIDLSNTEIPYLAFYNSYRESNPVYFDCFVEYSVNDGLTWTEIEVNLDSEGHYGWHYGEKVISLPECAGYSNVDLRFRHKSDTAFSFTSYSFHNKPTSWAWLIDDIRIYDFTDFNIEYDVSLEKPVVNFFEYYDYNSPEYADSNVFHSSSHYSQIPKTLFESENAFINFNAIVKNVGSEPVTPIVNVRVVNPNGDILYEEHVTGMSLDHNCIDTIDITNNNCIIQDPVWGKHLIIFNTVISGHEDYSLENNCDTVHFFVTDGVFSREGGDIDGQIDLRELPNENGDGIAIGTIFNMLIETQIANVSFYLGDQTDEGSMISIEVFEWNEESTDWESVMESDPLIIDQQNIGKWNTLEFNDNYFVQFTEGQTSIKYLVVIYCYFNGGNLTIGTSSNDNHNRNSTCFSLEYENFKIMDYYNNFAPAIRLKIPESGWTYTDYHCFIRDNYDSYCEGEDGVDLVVIDSKIGYLHKLYRNNSPTEREMEGTGFELVFDNVTEGNYNIVSIEELTGEELFHYYSNELIEEIPPFYDTTVVSICEGDSFEWQEQVYLSTGTYTESYQTIEQACDSIYVLELTSYPVPEQVGVLSYPVDGNIGADGNGSIVLDTSHVGTIYWTVNDGEIFSEEQSGTGNNLSLGDNYYAGTYDVWSRNIDGDCELYQGSVLFTDTSGNSIEDIQHSNNIKIYPNPTNGILHIKLNDVFKISITNIEGKTLLTKTINSSYTSLNLENFSKGVYFLIVETKRKTITRKIFIN